MIEKKVGIENLLSKDYKEIRINGERCFINSNNTVFKVGMIKEWNSFVVEYAESIEEAEKRRMEDGSLFDSEMETEEIVQEMKKEIEIS